MKFKVMFECSCGKAFEAWIEGSRQYVASEYSGSYTNVYEFETESVVAPTGWVKRVYAGEYCFTCQDCYTLRKK